MKLTIVQTRLGTFNAYILRDEGGRYLRADGTLTSDEGEARQFADVEHASAVAGQIEAAQPTPHLAAAAEVKVLDADHVEIYLPAGATLPAEYAGWTGEQSDWDPPSGEQRLHLARPQVTPAPTGHVRLAWLALVLLLASPFLAVADPPPAPDAGSQATPDAGSVLPLHLTPRRDPWLPMIDLPPQPHRPPAGDPPSPSTGDKPG